MDEDKEKKRKNSSPTPLWLVQALVLGVIYGLFSSEPLANDIAVAQANAVVSLAKSAGLHLPPCDIHPRGGKTTQPHTFRHIAFPEPIFPKPQPQEYLRQ